MSFRRLTLDGEALSLSRSAERTPLRSLQNEILHPATESTNVKSKFGSEPLKHAKVIVALEDTLKNIHASTDVACDESRHEHLGRHACSTKEPESEHAAHNPTNVTLKSYECDGGEVEIADELVEKADDTIPLPQPGLREQQTLDHSNVLDATDDCDIEGERADHLYYRRERGGKALQDKPADALCDVTLKSLNCTGGEIEIANSVNPDDQTIPLPTDQSGKDVDPCIDSVDSALFTEEGDHGDHLYCDVRAEDHFCVTNEASDQDLSEKKDLIDKQADCKDVSLLCSELDNESSNGSMEAASFVTEPQSRRGELASDGVLKQTDNPTEENNSLRESLIIPDIMVAPPSEDPSPNTGQSEKGQQQSQLDLSSSIASSQRSTHDGHHNATAAPSYPDVGEGEPHVCSSVPTGQANDATDSALGSSANAAPVSGEQSRAETLPDVFMAISERAPFLTPIVRRASLAYARAREELAAGQSLQRPGGLEDAEFWREHLDSPIPRPLFNSTELVRRSQTCIAAGASEGPSAARPGADDEPVAVVPVMPADPLQQQLRQVAEFLMLASGKMGHVHVPAPAATPPKAERHSACVGTTPMKMVNHSVNTSGQFEKRRSFSLVDQSTLTDPLLWNVSVGSLQNVPRPELEQRLLSSMIIVEALVQQSAAACVEALPTTGAALSELRERAVQTEHTELCQTSMHRDLYLEALNRIKELEMDATSLQELVQYMQNVKTNMNVLTSDTDAALGQMKQIGEVVREDHNILVSNYAQMRSLLEKSRASQVRMLQKVKEALQQREDMSTQMEQARSAKDSADSVMVQLRKHCSGEISELEKCVGSQQELLSALQRAHPEQVALNKAYSETLNSALELLSKTTEEQSRLGKELCAARRLLQKCTPTLLRLNKKADAALRERDQQIAERNQAIHDKEQTEDELNQALCNLQAANEQIGDLNLQVTILTSEMAVLRHKLSEGNEERAQLDRKATELSATVSSTLASYAFLEQALASETTKLQQSWADIKHVKDWAQDLESSLESSLERLEQSERRASELSAALAHSEGRVSELQSLCETRALQLQQLRETCGQLGGVQEENEFLQMENELSREQAVESERLLRANLQSLRERNIQCEDLNAELYLLRHANQNLQEELDCVRTELSSSQMEHKEKLDQMATEIAILHHVVRSTADELRENGENSDEPSPDNISSSFAPATEAEHCPGPNAAEAQSDLVFSESSAFTRITAVTPKKWTPERVQQEEEQSSVLELLAGLDATVTELRNTLALSQKRKDALLKERQDAICRLQRELEHANCTRRTEVSELQFELNRLKARLEKANVSLQQKAQGEKTVSKLVTEMSEIQEMLNKHKADNNELRKELYGLRRSLQQSKSEAQFLHDELRKSNGQLATDFMDEKIGLLMEMEKLKMSLQAEEQARQKLLERAKRHQNIYQVNQQKSDKELQMLSSIINKVRETLLCLPPSLKNCEQLQQLIEYVG